MNRINSIESFMSDVFSMSVPVIHITDIAEIIIIAVFFYLILTWVQNTRAWMLFRGIITILLFFLVAALLQMTTILWLGSRLINAGLIALLVVFQPELRSALDRLGRQGLFQSLSFLNLFSKPDDVKFSDRTISEIVRACYDMSAVKTGALIVIEQEIQLEEYTRTGIDVDSLISRALLLNIFEKNTPLHDGAVIIRGDRLVAATCYLPLSENLNLSKDLGTRHRAAVGISEVSDALVIIVSEETGAVSIAQDTRIIRGITSEGLTEILKHIQKPDELDKRNSGKRFGDTGLGIIKIFRGRKEEADGNKAKDNPD